MDETRKLEEPGGQQQQQQAGRAPGEETQLEEATRGPL